MYLAVARAVERPHRGLARAACGRRRVREHHERRRLVLRVQLGVEHARPRALDIAEHLARKHRARVVRRLALPLRGAGCACCWRPCSADAPSSITRGSIPKKYDAANATTIVPMPIVAPRPPPNPPAPRRSSTFVLSLSSSSLIAGPPCSCRWSGTRARNRAIGCRDTIPGRCNARARVCAAAGIAGLPLRSHDGIGRPVRRASMRGPPALFCRAFVTYRKMWRIERFGAGHRQPLQNGPLPRRPPGCRPRSSFRLIPALAGAA